MQQKQGEIKTLVARILDSYAACPVTKSIDHEGRINGDMVNQILEQIRKVIFPGYFEVQSLKSTTIEYHLGELLENIQYQLTRQVMRALSQSGRYIDCSYHERMNAASEMVTAFLDKIPELRRVLATDVQAAYDGDPAAFNTDEIILSYPGMYAITVNRIAHELHLLGVPLIPRMMTEHAHSLTGIDIHPGATIGEFFFIDHGTGVVIGETTVIGNAVKIYQGVTLGALSTRGGQSLRGLRRHPTLEDNVTVYSGASILGGNTIIGTGAVIGSNAFITSSVPAHTRVSIRNPKLQFKDRSGKAGELGQEGFFNRKEED